MDGGGVPALCCVELTTFLSALGEIKWHDEVGWVIVHPFIGECRRFGALACSVQCSVLACRNVRHRLLCQTSREGGSGFHRFLLLEQYRSLERITHRLVGLFLA